MTVEDEVGRDAHSALAVLRARPEIDGHRLFVLGHSLGGTLAPWITASSAPRPAGVLVLAGATLPLPEKMLEQVRYIAAADGTVTEESVLAFMLTGLPLCGLAYLFFRLRVHA